MKLNIKLKESGPEMPSIGGESREIYPEFTFREEDEPEFPDEGTMVIRYKKVRTVTDKKADKPYQCTLEVREIVSATGRKEEAEDESPTKKHNEAGDALDRLRDEKIKASY